MKRLAVAVLLLCLGSLEAAAQNRVPDGSFDNGLGAWFVDSRTTSTTAFTWIQGGAARITNTNPATGAGTASYVYSPCIPLTPGENIVFRGSMLRPSGQVGSGNGWVFLYWFRESDCRSGSSSFGTGPAPTDATTDKWQSYETSTAVPADARGARVGLIVGKGAAGGAYSILFDDIALFGTGNAPTIGITGPSVVTQNTPAAFNASAANCTARDGGWRWSAPEASLTGSSTSPQITLSWPQAGNFAITASHEDCGGASARFSVTVSPQSAQVVIVSLPEGMVQFAGQGGGTTSYTLANRGSVTAEVTLSTDADFFQHDPASLTIAPGAQGIVRIVGRPKAEGTFTGQSRISGSGVQAGLSIPIQLLSAPVPGGATAVSAPVRREEFVIPEGSNATGSVTFRNEGAGLAQGIVTSTESWLIPTTTTVSIPGGESRPVNFIIDAVRRQEAGIAAGSSFGSIVVRYLQPSIGKTFLSDADTAATARASATVVATSATAVTPGAIPALGLGEFAFIVPIVSGADAKVDVTVSGKVPASSVTGGQIYLLPSGGSSASRISLPGFGTNPLLYANIAKTIFQQTNISGALHIRGAANDAVLPAATLVAEAAGRPFSTPLPIFRSDRGAGSEEPIQLPGLRRDASVSTDLYLQEVAGSAASAAIEFRNDTGVVIASVNRSLQPFGTAHLADAVPTGATQVIVRLTGAGRAAAYGVARHSSGRRTVIADWRRIYGVAAADELVVPLIPRGEGTPAGRRVDLHVANAEGAGTATVTGELYTRVARRRGARLGSTENPGSAAIVRTWTIGPGASRTVRDLALTFGVPQLDGYLILKQSGGRPTSVLEVADPSSGGDIPVLVLPAVPRSSSRARGTTTPFVFDDVSSSGNAQEGAVLTGVGLVETAGAESVVRLTLQYPSKGSAAVAVPSAEFRVGPRGSLLVSDLVTALVGSNRPQLGDLRGARLQVQVTAGDGRIVPYLVQRDLANGDWIVRPPQ